MLARINKRHPSIFDEFFTREFMPEAYRHNGFKTTPAVNVSEDDNGFTIEVAAPGLGKKDFNINLDNDRLTISSGKESKHEDKNGNYSRKEFNYSSFCRSFTLPETIDADKIKASHKDGILYVSLPKRDEAKVKPAREISVS